MWRKADKLNCGSATPSGRARARRSQPLSRSRRKRAAGNQVLALKSPPSRFRLMRLGSMLLPLAVAGSLAVPGDSAEIRSTSARRHPGAAGYMEQRAVETQPSAPWTGDEREPLRPDAGKPLCPTTATNCKEPTDDGTAIHCPRSRITPWRVSLISSLPGREVKGQDPEANLEFRSPNARLAVLKRKYRARQLAKYGGEEVEYPMTLEGRIYASSGGAASDSAQRCKPRVDVPVNPNFNQPMKDPID